MRSTLVRFAARRPPVAAGLDIVSILLFVALGRGSHDEPGNMVNGTLRVAAPFLIALAIGWIVAQAWNRPAALRTGVVIWAITIVVGMLLRRTVFDRGTAASFVIVASLVTAALLLGWRALVSRRTRRLH